MSLRKSVNISTYRTLVYGLLFCCIILLIILVGTLSQGQQGAGADTTTPTRRVNANAAEYSAEKVPELRCVNGKWILLDEAVGFNIENIDPATSLDCGEPL